MQRFEQDALFDELDDSLPSEAVDENDHNGENSAAEELMNNEKKGASEVFDGDKTDKDPASEISDSDKTDKDPGQ